MFGSHASVHYNYTLNYVFIVSFLQNRTIQRVSLNVLGKRPKEEEWSRDQVIVFSYFSKIPKYVNPKVKWFEMCVAIEYFIGMAFLYEPMACFHNCERFPDGLRAPFRSTAGHQTDYDTK